MNLYNQHPQYREPTVPPRRKRSLSTSRFDSNERSYYEDTRLRSNLSTDHIPALYVQNQNFIPPNLNSNPNNAIQNSNIYFPLIPFNGLNYPQEQFNTQHPSEQLLPHPTPIRQPTTNINNQPSVLFAAMAGPLNSCLFNSYSGPQSPTRPHYRPHLKSSMVNNVQYNPYQSKFNPTLMAKPSLEAYQSSDISAQVANAIARGRDSMYSSKEQLNQYQFDADFKEPISPYSRFNRTKTPPLRPPPPKLSSKLSLENLSTFGTNAGMTDYNHDYAMIDRNRNRDRRSLSPTRISPTASGQRFYTGRSTSPIGNLDSINSYSPTKQLSRTTSVNYNRSTSRERTSREPSPMRSFINFSKNLLTPKSRNSFIDDKVNDTKNGSINEINNSINNECQNERKLMDELKVPNIQDAKLRMNELKSETITDQQQFSKAFTDHCDHYKSVTSKILDRSSRKSYVKDQTNDIHVDDKIIEDGFASKSAHKETATMPSAMNYQNSSNSSSQNNLPLMKPLEDKLLVEPINPETVFANKITDLLQQQPSMLRRNSSNTNLSAYQRKASLPAEYINLKNEQLKLSSEWSRENVAHLAHEAREKKLHPKSTFKRSVQNLGIWFTKQFVFLLICTLNIILAYIFYNLIVSLPKD